MPDKNLTCRDCNQTFVFTTGEQEFYASKGYTNEPGRCTACRGNRTDRRGPGGSTGGGGSFERRPQQMYPAVCAQCGKDTQVPFLPRGDRPVYCSTCFETQRGSTGGSRRSSGAR
ncbi:MAG: zinc-binding protein [Dehalococcoidia bacterium]|nr:zinc-binding protein [Dehalococcoidia bacterium]MSQ17540.1 zinc-binding protein [Dehalococcoidia bacterium]